MSGVHISDIGSLRFWGSSSQVNLGSVHSNYSQTSITIVLVSCITEVRECSCYVLFRSRRKAFIMEIKYEKRQSVRVLFGTITIETTRVALENGRSLQVRLLEASVKLGWSLMVRCETKISNRKYLKCVCMATQFIQMVLPVPTVLPTWFIICNYIFSKGITENLLEPNVRFNSSYKNIK
jgi:hypothetical protein